MVIGAGSVVTGAIPDCSVAVGNPARVIRRFDGEAGRGRRPDGPPATCPNGAGARPATGSSAAGRSGGSSVSTPIEVASSQRPTGESGHLPGR